MPTSAESEAKKAVFSTWQWLTILAVVAAFLTLNGIGMTVWAYSTFPQKADLKEELHGIHVELCRLNNRTDCGI